MAFDRSGQVTAAISGAFQDHPLLWLPDKPYDPAASSKEQRPGQGHQCAQCCFFDHTRTLEGLVHAKVTVRVLGPYYTSGRECAGLKDFFTQYLTRQPVDAREQSQASLHEPLIQAYPSKAAYCGVLEALAAQSQQPTAEVVNKVVAVMTMWAEGIAKGKLKVSRGDVGVVCRGGAD
jgi:hypothetical protein